MVMLIATLILSIGVALILAAATGLSLAPAIVLTFIAAALFLSVFGPKTDGK